MPLLAQDKAYPKIGSLSTILGLNDKAMTSVLVAAGLGRVDKHDASKKKSNLSELNKIFVGILASQFPQASDIVVEQLICASGLLCASQLKLFNAISKEKSHFEFNSFGQILPSQTTIGSCVKTTAAHNIIHQGLWMLKAAPVYLGSDKGGGVLIKMAFYFGKEEDGIKTVNLDFDKAGEDAQAGGV